VVAPESIATTSGRLIIDPLEEELELLDELLEEELELLLEDDELLDELELDEELLDELELLDGDEAAPPHALRAMDTRATNPKREKVGISVFM
jgi:hypothetical protein